VEPYAAHPRHQTRGSTEQTALISIFCLSYQVTYKLSARLLTLLCGSWYSYTVTFSTNLMTHKQKRPLLTFRLRLAGSR
jgi:hypothetical protein